MSLAKKPVVSEKKFITSIFFSFEWIFFRYIFHVLLQCRIQTFFGHTFFLKLRIGQFSDTQKPPWVAGECPKKFDVQCIWGRIFVSWKDSRFKVFLDYISFSFYVKLISKKGYKNFFGRIFFGAHTVQTVPKYIWMRRCYNPPFVMIL